MVIIINSMLFYYLYSIVIYFFSLAAHTRQKISLAEAFKSSETTIIPKSKQERNIQFFLSHIITA